MPGSVYRAFPGGNIAAAPVKFADVNGLAVGSGATVYTPSSGKKFNLLAFSVSASAGASLLLEEVGTTTKTVYRTPVLAANTPYTFSLGDIGYRSTQANATLRVTSSAAASITGTFHMGNDC
jgi:hypothetical protein